MIGTPDLKQILFRSHDLRRYQMFIVTNYIKSLLVFRGDYEHWSERFPTIPPTYFPYSETWTLLADSAASRCNSRDSWVRILVPSFFGVCMSICEVNTDSSPCFSFV